MTGMVRIVDQQSPWVGCTVPVVAQLPNGDVRVRVSETVIVGLVVGEYAPVHPLPDTALYRRMAAGHRMRAGHDLAGVVVDGPGGIGHLERSCCG